MGAAELINIMRKEISKTYRNEFSGFELATVVSAYPNLSIKIDNMNIALTNDDLIVCERLTRNTRAVNIKSQPGTARQLGDGTGTDENNMENGLLTAKTSVQGDHYHTLETFALKNSTFELLYVELEFEDVLKVGDRVLVQAVPGGQKYIIVDRVVEYDD